MGIVVGVHDKSPFRAHYQISCDRKWRTRKVNVKQGVSGTERLMNIKVDEMQRWWIRGKELTYLRGLQDVDLSITPSTNTLPIRRLRLAVSDSREISAAWVRFPDLNIELLPQRYTRLDEKRYRYESGNGTFVAEIEVDDLGLVMFYGNLWKCEAVANGVIRKMN